MNIDLNYRNFASYVKAEISQHPHQQEFSFEEGKKYGESQPTKEIFDAIACKYAGKGFDVKNVQFSCKDISTIPGVKKTGDTYVFSNISFSLTLGNSTHHVLTIVRPRKIIQKPPLPNHTPPSSYVAASPLKDEVPLTRPQSNFMQMRVKMIKDHLMEYMEQHSNQSKFIFISGETYNQVELPADVLKECAKEFGPNFKVQFKEEVDGLPFGSTMIQGNFSQFVGLFHNCQGSSVVVNDKPVNLDKVSIQLEIERI